MMKDLFIAKLDTSILSRREQQQILFGDSKRLHVEMAGKGCLEAKETKGEHKNVKG